MSTPIGLPPLNIVLIEDCPDLLEGWTDILSLEGHQVLGLTHGHEVLTNLDKVLQSDIVVSDYYLPDMNGVSLLAKIREHRPNIAAILLTGSKDPAVREHISTLSNVLLLYKPLSIEDMESALANCLKQGLINRI